MSDTPEDTYVHRDFLFLITGNHPHRGEHAHPVGKSRDTMSKTILFPGDEERYLLELIDCKHGTDRCYAPKSQMKMLKAPKK